MTQTDGVIRIQKVTDFQEQQRISRHILEALPEWFGIPEAREAYIRDSCGKPFFCACQGEKPAGFLYLKETGDATVELYAFMQVKTVQMGRYAEYDETNRFYQSMGFREFEVFPTLWDPWNPCQVYVMSLL